MADKFKVIEGGGEEQPRVHPSQLPLPGMEKAAEILESVTADEPIFVFRAKDILSTMVLLHYLTLVESYNPHSEQCESITRWIDQFRKWQHANPEKVKLPD